MFRKAGLLTVLWITGLLPAGCSEGDQAALCEQRTRRCLSIDTRDIEYGGTRRFAVHLANVCHEDIEYKLCFEVPGETADCRQGTLTTSERVQERIRLSRFGGRMRIFVRYWSEAKACRFPLTRDVEF